jgi:nitronate monooxygenase
MAGVQGVELALAVSGAGAMGSLPCAMLDAARCTPRCPGSSAQGANVNINFFCHQPPPVDPAREARWRAALLPYYRELGVDPDVVRCRAGACATLRCATADLLAEFKPARREFPFRLAVGRSAGAGAQLGHAR